MLRPTSVIHSTSRVAAKMQTLAAPLMRQRLSQAGPPDAVPVGPRPRRGRQFLRRIVFRRVEYVWPGLVDLQCATTEKGADRAIASGFETPGVVSVMS